MSLRCPSKCFDEASLAEQHAGPRRIRCSARGSSSRKSEPAHSVTIVASISRAGMMRQHAHGRVSRANSSWEKSMQFEKHLPRHRSPRALAVHRDGKVTFLSSGSPSSNAAAIFAGRSAAVQPSVHSCQSIDLRRTDGDGSRRNRSGTRSLFIAAETRGEDSIKCVARNLFHGALNRLPRTTVDRDGLVVPELQGLGAGSPGWGLASSGSPVSNHAYP